MLGVLLGGCGNGDVADPGDTSPPSSPRSASGRPYGPEGTLPKPDVAFHADVTITASAVHVSYRLINQGQVKLVVPDRLPRAIGAAVHYERGGAWATPSGDGVVLAQAFYARPDTDRKDWVHAPVVGVTEVAPGAGVQRELDVPLPLTWSHPWGEDLGDGPMSLPAHPASVTFCLGVREQPGELVPDEDSGVPLVAQGQEQHLLCSETVPMGD